MSNPMTVMVFAAGFGKRMRPLTDDMPKPLLPVAGKPIIDHILDGLNANPDVHLVIVNAHYKADILEAHIHRRLAELSNIQLVLSHEEEILETGGGVVNVLQHFHEEPFIAINGDILWKEADNTAPILSQLQAVWDDTSMDALLVLHPVDSAVGYDGKGDFDLGKNGKLARPDQEEYPYVFTGIQMLHPRLFYGIEENKPFSLSTLYRNAAKSNDQLDRMYGIVHTGEWFHIGTPEALESVDKVFRD